MAAEGGVGDGDSSEGADRPAGQDWRDATRFNQGEVWSSEAAKASESGRDRSPLGAVFVAGAAMLAVTLALRLATGSALAAFFAGVAAFVAVIVWRRSASVAAGAQRDDAPQPESARDQAVAALPEPLRDAVAEADEDLARMAAVSARLADRGALGDDVAVALQDAARAGREIVDAVVADPGDYDSARRFFKVMLPTARAAAEKFADQGVLDRALDARFIALMRDVAAAFQRQRENLRADERIDLEVEMSVLEDRVREMLGPDRQT